VPLNRLRPQGEPHYTWLRTQVNTAVYHARAQRSAFIVAVRRYAFQVNNREVYES
jgi:hypothetical protein